MMATVGQPDDCRCHELRSRALGFNPGVHVPFCREKEGLAPHESTVPTRSNGGARWIDRFFASEGSTRGPIFPCFPALHLPESNTSLPSRRRTRRPKERTRGRAAPRRPPGRILPSHVRSNPCHAVHDWHMGLRRCLYESYEYCPLTPNLAHALCSTIVQSAPSARDDEYAIQPMAETLRLAVVWLATREEQWSLAFSIGFQPASLQMPSCTARSLARCIVSSFVMCR